MTREELQRILDAAHHGKQHAHDHEHLQRIVCGVRPGTIRVTCGECDNRAPDRCGTCIANAHDRAALRTHPFFREVR